MAKIKTGSAIGLGAGLAAAAVAAALGSYLLTGKRAANTKRVLKSWMLKAKGEVLAQLENMEDLSQTAFDNAVDTVAAKYSKMAGVSKAEVEEMAKDLKKHWKTVEKEVTKKVKKAVK
jgi:hypothetical protein